MKRLALALLLLTACALVAQPAPVAPAARVVFEQRWPAADPQWFELVLQSDGSARYRSLAHQEANAAAPTPEPFEFNFTLSPKSRQQVFALGPRLSGFKDSLDKSKVAFTGTKTLRYEDGAGNSPSISYGFTSSPELRAVTELLDGISETIELGERLRFQLRFDKLALDSTLRGAEELVSLPRLPERQILEPILTRIADDATVMNIARQRARRILKSPAN